MSLFDQPQPNQPPATPPPTAEDKPRAWGKIFASGREHSLGNMEHGPSTRWSEVDEAAYLERVRIKAAAMASRILADAAEEAERLRTQGKETGYTEGLAAAQEELDAFRAGMADSVAAVLSAIEGQCSHVLGQWREDLVAVARLVAEKTAGTILTEERGMVLRSLLLDSLHLLEERRDLLIRVHPEDEPMLTDIISLTKATFPDIIAWRVHADPSLTPGGLVVESASSLAEGRVEARKAAVDSILQKLHLPVMP